jgi:hypothetical protein
MDAKQLNKVIRSLNKATKAIEDQSLELCDLTNRIAEYVDFLENEIKTLQTVEGSEDDR